MDRLHHLGPLRTGSTSTAALKAPPWWRGKWCYLLALFACSKAIITMVGLVCVPAFDPIVKALHTTPSLMWMIPDVTRGTDVREYNAFTMWFRWDSIQYVRMTEFPFWRPLDPFDFQILDRARLGERLLPTFSLGRFAWAPLFILLGKGVSVLVGGKVTVALFLVANLAFFGCLHYAYALGEHLFGTPEAARKSAFFLCLLPSGFMLQVVMPESLFVCLLMATMYYLSKRRWLLATLTAILLGLTRSTGMLMALPFGLLVLHMCRWRLDKARTWLTGIKALPAILGAPLGWGIFLGYCKYMTGDWQVYTLIQRSGWGVEVSSPVQAVIDALHPLHYTYRTMQLALIFGIFAVLLLCLVRLPVAYSVAGLVLATMAMSIGSERWGFSILRYLGEIFPPALLAAWATIKWRSIQLPIVCGLVALQSGLFLLWTLEWLRAIV